MVELQVWIYLLMEVAESEGISLGWLSGRQGKRSEEKSLRRK